MKHILVVDDDENILDLVNIHLTREGYHVTKATDGIDALEQAENSIPDIAVVDVMMPIMDGFTLTKELRELYDIPVILLTAKGELDDKEKGFLARSEEHTSELQSRGQLVCRPLLEKTQLSAPDAQP